MRRNEAKWVGKGHAMRLPIPYFPALGSLRGTVAELIVAGLIISGVPKD
jgi:hypothetical protein